MKNIIFRCTRLFMTMIVLHALSGCAISVDDRVLVGAPRMTDTSGSVAGNFFLSDALNEEADFTFSVNAQGQKATWHRDKDQVILADIESTNLDTDYGKLDILVISARDHVKYPQTRPLFVHCYGNASNLYNNATITALVALPYGDVLQFEYPGYDLTKSPENGSVRNLGNFETMTTAIIDYLNQQSFQRPLIFWGHSLGGPVCTRIAAQVPQSVALVLEATAGEAKKMARNLVPILVRPLIKFNIDPRLTNYDIPVNIVTFKKPVLMLSATKDRVIPIRQSRNLRDELLFMESDLTYHEFNNANHISITTDPAFKAVMASFLNQVLSQ